MLKKMLFVSMILSMSLTACVNDASLDEVETPEIGVEGEGNVTFKVVVPNSFGFKAGNAEDSGIHDQGSAAEYAVHNVTLYLFNEATGNIYKKLVIDELGTPNTSNLTVTYPAKSYLLDPGTYRVLAVANARNLNLDAANLNDFIQEVDRVSYNQGTLGQVPQGGIIMTNRVSNSPVVTVKTDDHAKASIELERVLAKIVMSKKNATYDLVDDKDSVYAQVTPTNFEVVNLSKEYYLFRHTAVLPNATETPAPLTKWDINTNFGTIADTDGYAIDPNFFNKTLAYVQSPSFDGASMFVNPLADAANMTYQPTFAAAGSHVGVYCLANTNFCPAQVQGYTTGIIVKANLSVPEDRCFDEKGNKVAQDDQPTVLYYFNYNFYTSLQAVKEVGHATLPEGANPSDSELAAFQIKRFTKVQGSFNMFYNYWIKHLDNGMPTHRGVMEYAIVRNNIYNITITKVLGLGDGTPNVDPVIPVEKKGYLDVDFSVKPWIVRNQDAELE